LPHLPALSRDARSLALLERIAVGVEGMLDEMRKANAMQALAQEARALAPHGDGGSANGAAGHHAASNAHACELLTAADLCALLKLDARTLRVLRHEGRVPEPIKLGRSLRWRRAEIEMWVAGGPAGDRP
jgi:predicted DNA-binding transcriptional regulator AlpA